MENAKKYAPNLYMVYLTLVTLYAIAAVIFLFAALVNGDAMYLAIVGSCVGGMISLWLNMYLACLFFDMAVAKGYEDGKYLVVCFWLGTIGYLLIVAMPDRGEKQERKPMYPNAVPVAPVAPVAPTAKPGEGSWRCTCGKVNPKYVATCSCGMSKWESERKSGQQ